MDLKMYVAGLGLSMVIVALALLVFRGLWVLTKLLLPVRLKTRGERIRKSNESLAKFMSEQGCGNSCAAFRICFDGSSLSCEEAWLAYLNGKG